MTWRTWGTREHTRKLDSSAAVRVRVPPKTALIQLVTSPSCLPSTTLSCWIGHYLCTVTSFRPNIFSFSPRNLLVLCIIFQRFSFFSQPVELRGCLACCSSLFNEVVRLRYRLPHFWDLRRFVSSFRDTTLLDVSFNIPPCLERPACFTAISFIERRSRSLPALQPVP